MKKLRSNLLSHLGLAALFAGTMTVGTSCVWAVHERPSNLPDAQRVRVIDETGKNGLFDPSLEYGPDGIGWMAYSSIEIPKRIETHIAKSLDHGKTWALAGRANTSESADIQNGNRSGEAIWRHETPSLLFDPTDGPGRRWKLFTNRYFVTPPFKPTDRHMSEGTIEMRQAASPDGPWSDPVCVFGPAEGCRVDLRDLSPSLSDIKFMTEPGTIEVAGILYMSLDVGTTAHGLGDWEHYRVILLASKDHGRQWRYAGTLLDHADAMRFQYLVFTGTSLVRVKNRLYLFATPSGATHKARRDHDGTMVFELSDMAQAKVARDASGTPIVVQRIDVTLASGGLADFDEGNTAGGIVMAQFNLFGMPEVFQLWNARRTIPESPSND